MEMEVDEVSTAAQLQLAAAKLLSDIKNSCRTSQRALDVLVTGINSVVDLYLIFLKDKLDTACSKWDGNITLERIHSVLSSLKGQSVFEGVQTSTKLDSYIQTQSGGQKVILKKIVLKSKKVIRSGIPRQVPTHYGYAVPFLAQLEQLLNCKDVLECVDNPIPCRSGVPLNVNDGLFYKFNDVVKAHGPTTLSFYIHVDDAETCDALKSKAGYHNLRLYYWVLGNIHPKKRSSLRAINLLAIVRAAVAKAFGNQPFLKDFMEGIKKLGTEGVDFNINGVIRRFYGILLFCSADNPAAANLGGFKETHSALRPCRVCMVKSSDLNKCFVQDNSLIRKLADHKRQLEKVTFYKPINFKEAEVKEVNVYENEEDEIDDPSDIEVPLETYLDHKNPSVNYGINGKSPLADAPGFDETKCFPQDLLHLCAEGVVELTCRKVLRDLCIPPPMKPGQKKVKAPLSLTYVNKVIETCDLGRFNVSRPSRIDSGHLKGSKLKQSASQLLILMYLLPFILHNVCPQEKLDLLLELGDLVTLCGSFELSEKDNKRIENMVEEFGKKFVAIYPGVKSLKLHCLVHLSMQARLFGPLRQQWCFRFEAMHSKFTDIAEIVRSRKDVALSCAKRYLSARNTELVRGKEDGHYLSEGDKVSGLNKIKICDLHEEGSLLERFLSGEQAVLGVEHIHRDGNQWKKGVVILIEKNGQESLFGRVRNVYINEEGQILFVYQEYVTTYVANLRAFQVVKCKNQLQAVKLDELMHPFPIARFSFNVNYNAVAFLLLQSPGGDV